MAEFVVGIWNQGQNCDYRNVGLRSGGNLSDERKRQRWEAVNVLYAKALEHFAAHGKKAWWEHPRYHVTAREQEILCNDREHRIREIYNHLFAECDIVLLQNVSTPAELRNLRENSAYFFNLVYGKEATQWSDGLDTALLYRKERFELLFPEGAESEGSRYTRAVLRDKTTQKVIQCVAVHCTGFDLLNPKSELKYDETRLKGDEEIEHLLMQLETPGTECAATLVAGSFNSEYDPRCDDEEGCRLAKERFSILEREGFGRIETTVESAYSAAISQLSPKGDGLCTLDHLFVRGKGLSAAFFPELSGMWPLEDVSKNPSEHRPLFFKAVISE